ncbi:MAG: hypothetical protein R3E58_04665 [Phycisphaerae bacterium]
MKFNPIGLLGALSKKDCDGCAGGVGGVGVVRAGARRPRQEPLPRPDRL